MKNIKTLTFITIFFLLTACASSPEPVKYYSLNLNSDQRVISNSAPANTKKTRVVVGPIYLAKFLRQDGMVMQIGEHEIYTPNYHRWAEPLDEAIAKLLVQELNGKSNKYQFERMVGQWNQNAKLSLRFEFEKFHATDNAKIVASGRYWLYEKDKTVKIDQSFNISNSLTRDGYLHTVEKLKQAIETLSGKIIDVIEQSQ